MLRHPKGEIIIGRLKFTEFNAFSKCSLFGEGGSAWSDCFHYDNKKAVSRIPQEQKKNYKYVILDIRMAKSISTTVHFSFLSLLPRPA